MADRWFRVPTETIDGVDGPKYRDRSGITGFSGNTIGNSPKWVVRFYGDKSTLNKIASENDATELTASEAAQRFANATDQPQIPDREWDAATVDESFRVST